MSEETKGLGTRAARGAAWMFGLNFTNRAMGLVRTAIVARLLGPEGMGVFGAALLFMSVLETLTQTGLHSALVQKKDEVEPYLDTAWVWSGLRGTVVGVALLVGAPAIAAFFREPGLVLLVRIIAITEFLGGFANMGIVQFNRSLQFRQIYLLTAIPTAVDIAVSIVAAFITRSPLAMALGYLARWAVWSAMTYMLHPYRPRFRFDKAKAKELYTYGRWITGTAWLDLLYSSGDDIFVGRVMGTASLGLYQVAYKYSNLPTSEITKVVHSVALPAYSRLQEDEGRVRKAYADVLKVTALGSVALAGAIWVLAGDLTYFVLGTKWLAAVPLLRILAVWGALESVTGTSATLFQALGKPGYATRVLGVKTLLLAVLIYPLSRLWGLEGTSWAVVASSVPALAVSLVWVRRLASVPGRTLLLAVTPPAVAAAVVGAVGWWIGTLVPEGGIVSLGWRTAALLGVYGVAALGARTAGYDGVDRLIEAGRKALGRSS